ncbi:MAG: alpha/beta hydrolase [Fuerstiella sp.]|nr:alpha/beta hydrolase [Fuerstiella sp.]
MKITEICRRLGVLGGTHCQISSADQRPSPCLSALTFVTTWMAWTSFSVAAQTAGDTISDHILTTTDQWPVHVTYLKSDKGKEAPVVVLLTAASGDVDSGPTRRVWTELAKYLQKNGFAVLSVDLRKHGDSKLEKKLGKRQKKVLPLDYRNMVIGDMEAVKAFLLEQHQQQELNIRKMGIVTDGASGLVGAGFALNDWRRPPYQDAPKLVDRTPRGQDVRAIVMFSPRSVRGFNHTKILRPLSDLRMAIAFRIYHSSEDMAEQKFAQKLFKIVDLKGDDFDDLRSIESAPASGEGFLKGRVRVAVQKDLKRFLNKHLTELPSPWETRTSALDR